MQWRCERGGKRDFLRQSLVVPLIWPFTDFTHCVSCSSNQTMFRTGSQNVIIVSNCTRPFTATASLISDKIYVSILISVRAAEIGLVICRKPHHTERLCTEAWKGAQSSDGHKRLALPFPLGNSLLLRPRGCHFSFSAAGRLCCSGVPRSIVLLSIFSFTSPGPGYVTQKSHNILTVLRFRGH